MSMHLPERDAARFLAGDLGPAERTAFESHLLECEECWSEVGEARRGRSIAEGARESAPAALRDRVRATISELSAEPAVIKPLHARWVVRGSALVVAASLLLFGVLSLRTGSTPQPAVVSAALAAFESDRLPGTHMVTHPVPDLSALSLRSVGTGKGEIAGMAVEVFAYRDDAQHRVFVYLGASEFPRAARATNLAAEGGAWMAHDGATALVCALPGHSMLIVGTDDALLTAVGSTLRAM